MIRSFSCRLRSDELLHCVARNGVEEEQHHERDGDEDESLEDCPLVIVPNYVANGFQWVEEPHEGRIGTTERRRF
jgi:hypothetical protein